MYAGCSPFSEYARLDIVIDPSDQLPAIATGEWTTKKHKLLRYYVDISKEARRGWTDPAVAAKRKVGKPAGATYIELFCGPGRVFIDKTGNFADGSPLVAYAEAARTRTGFTAMHLGDERADFCDAARRRLEKLGIKPTMYPMTAQLAAEQIVAKLNPYGLNFAFLDPFGFEGLPFSIIETFGRFRRMDVLIYVSAMGLQRNLPEWVESDHCPLDDFAPDWRKVVRGLDPSGIVARGRVFEHWRSLIGKVGFQDPPRSPPLIRGPENQPLYWLILVAKHELASKFWEAISKDEHQNSLFS